MKPNIELYNILGDHSQQIAVAQLYFPQSKDHYEKTSQEEEALEENEQFGPVSFVKSTTDSNERVKDLTTTPRPEETTPHQFGGVLFVVKGETNIEALTPVEGDVSSSLNHAVIQVSCIDQPLSLVDVKVTLVQNHKIDSLLTSGILEVKNTTGNHEEEVRSITGSHEKDTSTKKVDFGHEPVLRIPPADSQIAMCVQSPLEPLGMDKILIESVKSETSDLQEGYTESQSKSSSIKSETSDTQSESYYQDSVESITIPCQSETSSIKSEASDLQSESFTELVMTPCRNESSNVRNVPISTPVGQLPLTCILLLLLLVFPAYGRASVHNHSNSLSASYPIASSNLCMLPASAPVQTNISRHEQCPLNSSFTIPWTSPQCFCSLPLQKNGTKKDTQKQAKLEIVWYQPWLFYFLFGAIFILLYLKWLHLDHSMKGVPEAEGMEDGMESIVSRMELEMEPEVKKFPTLPLLYYYWTYENSESSTPNSVGTEESSFFASSYHPSDPEQHSPSSNSETGLFVINQNARKIKQATNPAIMIIMEGSVGKPGGSIDIDSTEEVDDPVSIATEESVEDANMKILHSQEQEFLYLLDRNDVESRPRKVTFDGNNSNSACVVPKSQGRHDIEGNLVYLHNRYPRLVPFTPSNSTPPPKPCLPKIPTESGCGMVLQNGAKTLGCMVEPDITKDELELLPLCEEDEDSLSDRDNLYSCYDLPHLVVKPFIYQYGED